MRRFPQALLGLAMAAAVAVSPSQALDINEEVTLPDAEVGTFYSFQLEAEEGCLPYRFSFSSGRLPAGLQVTPEGELVGSPAEAGLFEFYVAVDDSPTCASPQSQGRFTLRVLPDLAVASSELPRARPGAPYRARLEPLNPEEGWPLRWSVRGGTLPPGLTLAEDGTVAGTPTQVGLFTFVARVEEPFRRFGERDLRLAVSDPLALGAVAPAPGEVGLRYRFQPSFSGGLAPLSWALERGTLPPGLALDAATGAIAGLPREAGSFSLSLMATDLAGERASASLLLRIVPKLAIATEALPPARVGRPYGARLGSQGGLGPVRWRLPRGTLPPGVRLKPNGLLQGTPRAAGTYPLLVEARDRLGARALASLVLRVEAT
ncbi:MAG: hypothetical protein C4306_07895 [Thermoleophilia bacterium]